MATKQQKAMISLLSALTFSVMSSPFILKSANKITGNNIFYDTLTGCKTNYGHLLATLLFFIVIYAQMFIGSKGGASSNLLKLKYSLYGALIFFFLASASMYTLTGSFSSSIANVFGCPTALGRLLHSVVYFAILYGIMFLPKDQ